MRFHTSYIASCSSHTEDLIAPPWILDMLVEPADPTGPKPADPTGPKIEIGFLADRGMRLEGIDLENRRLAQSGQGLHHPFRLNEKGACIVVLGAVIHQKRSVDVVRIEDGRHLQVSCRGLLERGATGCFWPRAISTASCSERCSFGSGLCRCRVGSTALASAKSVY